MICLNKAGLACTPYVDAKFRSESFSSWDVEKNTKQEMKIKHLLKIKKIQTKKE